MSFKTVIQHQVANDPKCLSVKTKAELIVTFMKSLNITLSNIESRLGNKYTESQIHGMILAKDERHAEALTAILVAVMPYKTTFTVNQSIVIETSVQLS